MAKSKAFKLYKLHIALIDRDGEEVSNWRSETVVATDAAHAIGRVRMGKGEFVESVELIAHIDKP